jgi:FkbM family methyltransferase
MEFSQYGQDSYVRDKYLSNIEKGFFLELGALDGLRHSNTKSFEDLGWSGICIEAHPALFRRLIRNRQCVCIEALISSTGNRISSFLAIDPNGPVGLSGLLDNYDPRHVQRIVNECQAAGVNADKISIQSRTLADVLREHSVAHVDFFSLDVEGAELDVLRSINWNEVDFGLLLIENNYGLQDVCEFLYQKGYKKAETRGLDDIYLRA